MDVQREMPQPFTLTESPAPLNRAITFEPGNHISGGVDWEFVKRRFEIGELNNASVWDGGFRERMNKKTPFPKLVAVDSNCPDPTKGTHTYTPQEQIDGLKILWASIPFAQKSLLEAKKFLLLQGDIAMNHIAHLPKFDTLTANEDFIKSLSLLDKSLMQEDTRKYLLEFMAPIGAGILAGCIPTGEKNSDGIKPMARLKSEVQQITRRKFLKAFGVAVATVASTRVLSFEGANRVAGSTPDPSTVEQMTTVINAVGPKLPLPLFDYTEFRTALVAQKIADFPANLEKKLQVAKSDPAVLVMGIAHIPNAQDIIGNSEKRKDILQKGIEHIVRQFLPITKQLEKQFPGLYFTQQAIDGLCEYLSMTEVIPTTIEPIKQRVQNPTDYVKSRFGKSEFYSSTTIDEITKNVRKELEKEI